MNITELGIGTAVGVTLYKPLCIRLYSKVGKIIGSVGIGISLFLPLIFEKTDMPL